MKYNAAYFHSQNIGTHNLNPTREVFFQSTGEEVLKLTDTVLKTLQHELWILFILHLVPNTLHSVTVAGSRHNYQLSRHTS